MLKLVKQGKNCDIFENPDYPDLLFLNRTNRVSVGDVVFPAEICYKGLIQNMLSIKWADYLAEEAYIPNHIVAIDAKTLIKYGADASMAGSLVAVKKTHPIPIECIVRGYYIPESKSWQPYKECGEMYGYELPAGLRESEKLPEPIYTPSTKAEMGKHDENISYEETIPIIKKWIDENFESLRSISYIVAEEIAIDLKTLSLDAYETAYQYALQKGIILADTKLEFGLLIDEDGDYDILLIDEVFTPDSSRFWDATKYEIGVPQESMDKQFLRRIVYNDLKWDGNSEPPEIPAYSQRELSDRYSEIFERLFDENIVEVSSNIVWEWQEAAEQLHHKYSSVTESEIAEYTASLKD